MRRALSIHPASSPAPAIRIDVEIGRPSPAVLALRYAVTGAVGELVLPSRAAPVRADELWRHTCFEAFVRTAPGEGYIEFNFAPSTQWAAYRFAGYRSGMTKLEGIDAPRIESWASGEAYQLRTSLAPVAPAHRAWRVALAAVIEQEGGRKSYWALAHPPGRPDFHHEVGFVLELPPATP
jgi:hypothetical protein